MVVSFKEFTQIIKPQVFVDPNANYPTGYITPQVAMTSMPGDPIHPGHISCLQSMRKRCLEKGADPNLITVCVVNGDQFLINKKGHAFIPIEDRCNIIDNIKNGVDYVIPFNASDPKDQTVCEAIKLIKPTYFCKGGDRTADSTLPEWDVCQEVGCTIIDKVGADKIWSSSNYLSNYEKFINNKFRVIKPWGSYKTILLNTICAVKELYINEGHRLSLQFHNNRSEKWLIVSGKAKITLDDKVFELCSGESIEIGVGQKHRIEALTDVIVSEWWISSEGKELSENDIVRIEDDYNR